MTINAASYQPPFWHVNTGIFYVVDQSVKILDFITENLFRKPIELETRQLKMQKCKLIFGFQDSFLRHSIVWLEKGGSNLQGEYQYKGVVICVFALLELSLY